jgi:hypothetical protein
VEDLVPDPGDVVDLGEEAVAPDVEPVALVLARTRDAPDDVILLEDQRRAVVLGELVCRRQAGRAGSDDDDILGGLGQDRFLARGASHARDRAVGDIRRTLTSAGDGRA